MTAHVKESPPEKTASILLVDDNPTNLQLLMQTLDGQGHKILAAKNGELALKIAKKAKPSLVLLDIMMPGIDGYEVCQQLKEDPGTRDSAVIFLSSLDEVQDKVRGFQLGAVDFITKPFQAEEVLIRVKTQLMIHTLKQDIQAQNLKLKRELKIAQELNSEASQRVEGPLLGDSQSVALLRSRIERLAGLDAPILMTGPPGAGYEAIAREIHQRSSRAERAFFHINCSTLQTVKMPLFPMEDETEESTNKFLLADGGTIYLDRIHELSMVQQNQLLDFLKQAESQRQAGQIPLPNIRLVVYSNTDLHQAAQEGKFVLGLIPYLSLQHLTVPSLVERREDIPTLAHFYLRQHAQKLGKMVSRLSDTSLEHLQSYSWPGNIDELKSLIERQTAVTQDAVLEIDESLLEGGLSMGGYQLVELLGKGGMGEVWRAKHQLLSRPAAIKLIRTEGAKSAQDREAALKRFQREARVTSHLNSPHTVTLYDFGVDDSGAFYYVMELLYGMDLLTIVEQFGPLSPERLVFAFKGICRSLEEAHSRGLIHRDIKPANIFLSKLGPDYDIPKVLDFGIVKGELGTAKEDQLTQISGASVVGTPGYIAPEAISNKTPIDHRFDIYSLGCVAYWALSGRELFVDKVAVMQVLFAHVMEEPEPLSSVATQDIPADLEQLIHDCLQKDPNDRPANARVLWERLNQIQFDDPWSQEKAEPWWLSHRPEFGTPSSDLTATQVE